ncbi:polyprenol monophosphomannose synthase [Cardinium endosymbiont of Tipula unca]|uniref:polyprenol monophosphomannose synthase n=1 Tax=Cardinium endosymbiont of Tipula unca TaxID=3066216 RepID=UPI0030CBF283
MLVPSNTLVVIPTYNECDNITPLISAIFDLKMGLHLLIVDDNSPDGTARVVEGLQQYHSHQLHLLNRPQKEGLGKAYLAGFSWALLHNYAYICTMDADFSHAPSDLPRLLSTCAQNKIDVAIGSRYIPGGRVVHWPRTRLLLSHLANWIARCITGIPFRDTTAGFICYKRAILKNILLDEIISVGYSFQVEIKFLAYQHGAKLVEIPVTFTNRTRGLSKMNLKIAGESFLQLLQMKWRNLVQKRR